MTLTLILVVEIKVGGYPCAIKKLRDTCVPSHELEGSLNEFTLIHRGAPPEVAADSRHRQDRARVLARGVWFGSITVFSFFLFVRDMRHRW